MINGKQTSSSFQQADRVDDNDLCLLCAGGGAAIAPPPSLMEDTEIRSMFSLYEHYYYTYNFCNLIEGNDNRK